MKQFLVKDPKQAVQAAKKLGYPVVLKVSSKDVIHKTDMGGIRVNLKNAQEVEKAYAQILKTVRRKKPMARIDGLLVHRVCMCIRYGFCRVFLTLF